MNLRRILTRICFFAAGVILGHEPIFAQSPSHAYIDNMRSGYNTHYYFSVLGEAEFGDMIFEADAASENAEPIRDRWQGFGLRNEVGVEFGKFLQFNLGYTSIQQRSREGVDRSLSGSRMNFGASLNFSSPMGNMQIGGGLLGSRLDFRQATESADFYGSGQYYSVGYNYFLTSQISFYASVRQIRERLVRNAGSEVVGLMQSRMNNGALGFNIWL